MSQQQPIVVTFFDGRTIEVKPRTVLHAQLFALRNSEEQNDVGLFPVLDLAIEEFFQDEQNVGNRLRLSGVTAVGQLVDLTVSELRKIPGIGEKSVALVVERLTDEGISLRASPAEVRMASETLIEELDLSVRAYNCLKRAGIQVVGDLLGKAPDQLLGIPNFDAKHLDEVVVALTARGLRLSGK